MQILVDKNNLITSFATVGGFDGGIEVENSKFPDTFVDEFRSGKFIYDNDSIIYNREYIEPPKEVEPPTNNEAMQQEVNSLKQQVAELTELIQSLLNK